MSVVPPGVNGTTKWIGRVGYTCALAICAVLESMAVPATARRNLRRGSVMPMPREIEIVSRRSFDHIEQRLECLLGAQSEHPSRAHQCPFFGRTADINEPGSDV